MNQNTMTTPKITVTRVDESELHIGEEFEEDEDNSSAGTDTRCPLQVV